MAIIYARQVAWFVFIILYGNNICPRQVARQVARCVPRPVATAKPAADAQPLMNAPRGAVRDDLTADVNHLYTQLQSSLAGEECAGEVNSARCVVSKESKDPNRKTAYLSFCSLNRSLDVFTLCRVQKRELGGWAASPSGQLRPPSFPDCEGL